MLPRGEIYPLAARLATGGAARPARSRRCSAGRCVAL